jgi:hypothetical protein
MWPCTSGYTAGKQFTNQGGIIPAKLRDSKLTSARTVIQQLTLAEDSITRLALNFDFTT